MIRIGDKEIGCGAPPFVIAELSGNHNQSLDRALAIVDAAVETGVHCVKLQTYTADTITLDIKEREFFIGDPSSPWYGQSMYELYEKAHTPWEWHEPIMKRCREHGLLCFSSPFDDTAVDFLEELNAPAYKIASPENVDIPLIRKAASTGKPVIISSGMASEEELAEAVEAAKSAGDGGVILLKCTTDYPADASDANLMTIPNMRERFGVDVGLSDHTLGIGVAVASVALGSVLIEKHFTLARSDGGVDAAFSLEPAEMKSLVEESLRAWNALGHATYGPSKAEEKNLVGRRSLYITQDIRAGEELTADNVRSIRPGLGLPPKHLDEVLGRKVKKDVARGTPLHWSLLE
ncbi:MAG: pseudaminic acid synthase [Verrucomicrobia bacterium]|nr:pseudaminic acid synthase [Verrucomicrobiota bacterium]